MAGPLRPLGQDEKFARTGHRELVHYASLQEHPLRKNAPLQLGERRGQGARARKISPLPFTASPSFEDGASLAKGWVELASPGSFSLERRYTLLVVELIKP